jgi:hypothetical protein
VGIVAVSLGAKGTLGEARNTPNPPERWVLGALKRARGGLGRGSGWDKICASASVAGEAGEGRPSRQGWGGRGEVGPRLRSAQQGIVIVVAPAARGSGGGRGGVCARETECEPVRKAQLTLGSGVWGMCCVSHQVFSKSGTWYNVVLMCYWIYMWRDEAIESITSHRYASLLRMKL